MFSVVIPLYNKAPTIVDTVRSVLAQDFPDFEVVIVDDGSTDDGPDQVDRSFTDSRIRVIRQKNAGEGAARNSGIDAARYQWIAPLDADDVWLPEYLSQVNEAIRQFPKAQMFCCGGAGRYPDGSGFVRQSRDGSTYPRKVDYYTAPFFYGNASSTVFSKELATSVGGFPVGMAHQPDVVFFFKMALLTDVVFCPAPLSVYNLGLPGQVSGDRRANIAGTVESSNQIYSFWATLDPDRRDPQCIAAVVNNTRGALRYALANSDYELVEYCLENLDPRFLRRFTAPERFLYPRRRLRPVALALNRAFEVRRRMNAERPIPSSDVTKDISDARRQLHLNRAAAPSRDGAATKLEKQ